jgi:glycosyltransferase involved in cell wall biosynthesis
VRDLPALGWSPGVLTVRPQDYLAIELDPALCNKVPASTRVVRAAAPALHRGYKRLIEAGKRLRGGKANALASSTPGSQAATATPVPESATNSVAASASTPAAAPASTPAAAPASTSAGAPNVRSPLDLAYMLCRTPDIDSGWYVPALVRGLWAVLRQRPRVLYATGGPWTTFLVARDLARLTRLPLVLDYRDPWTLNPAVVRSGNFFETLALRLERTVVRRARYIVANTDVLRETLARAHGDAIAAKTVVIHNSYDAADYESPAPPRETVFTLSYVGAMYDAHSPEPLLQAMVQLAAQRPDLRGRFRVRLVGAGAPRIAARVRSLGIEAFVDVGEPVPHAEAVRLQRAAHVLVLLLTVPSDHSTFVPSKLYEYIAANRPILAVTRGGALDRLLRGRQLTPWIYRPEDTLGIAQGLLNLYERYERDCLPALPEATVRSFSGIAAARALAGVLEAASSGAPLRPFEVATAATEAMAPAEMAEAR